MDQRRIVPRATKSSFEGYNTTHFQTDPAEFVGHLEDIWTEEYIHVNISMYLSSCIQFQVACVYNIVSAICPDEL